MGVIHMSFAEKIEHLFGFHAATTEGDDATAPKHETLRDKFTDLAKAINEIVPDGDLKDKVILDLKAVSMWANQAVAQTAPLVQDLVAELKPTPATAETPVQEPLPVVTNGEPVDQNAVEEQPHEATPPAAADAGVL